MVISGFNNPFVSPYHKRSQTKLTEAPLNYLNIHLQLKGNITFFAF